MDTTSSTIDRLIQIMDELREKCPWDRKQTLDSLRPMTIEETHELADAIIEGDWKGIREELGDLLLHIVFYAKIGQEQEKFTLNEVIDGICQKLIVRHPHVYGDVSVSNDEDVKRNWEKIKLTEGKSSVLSGVPRGLPSLVKASRLQEKARQVGFDWNHEQQVWDKVQEELSELQSAIDQNRQGKGNAAQVNEEFGDVLFSLVNYARFLDIDPDAALEKTNKKFMYRFQMMESQAASMGKKLHDMSLAELDKLWETAKQK